MKKAMATLFTAAVLMLLLAACGGNDSNSNDNEPTSGNNEPPITQTEATPTPKPTQEPEETETAMQRMLAIAEEATIQEVSTAVAANRARAEQTYFGNPFTFNVRITAIERNHIVSFAGGDYFYRIYFYDESI